MSDSSDEEHGDKSELTLGSSSASAARAAEVERRVDKIRGPSRRRRWIALIVIAGFGAVVAFIAAGVIAVLFEAEREQVCHSNLIQLSMATQFYDETYRSIPTGRPRPRLGDGPYSWRVEVLPFIEQQALFDRYAFAEPWDSAANRAIAAETPRQFVCLAEGRDPETTTLTSYFAIDGAGTLFEQGQPKSLRNIPDSSAATLMYVEAHGRDVVWTEPRDLSPMDVIGTGPTNALASRHWNGANVVYADGSVRSLSPDVDPVVLKALMTDAGGESVQRPETR